ncbi:glycosyltransferase family 1 protein [Sulfitobacter sp. F26169L]|uniref:glycosyltransferase family 4 protein n=1 Tax=Sulfitobacter sp. F26169L TaxID=2996015 RepID=UPI002260FC11|nr:glycosyltransferase family 1 protein [Sulfitobacter sp. F26169L]MCX7565951.1 glycosyltransferase family 1 protein [Sulfitobacter sp. F26169L]
MEERQETAPPQARLLDFTRLMRRAGRVFTGVDRVELAYLEALLAEPVPVWGLARTPVGYVLLNSDGLVAFHKRLTGSLPWSSPDLLSRLQRGASDGMRRAQTDARKLSVARCTPNGLARMLCRNLPCGTAYLNTGHSNLSTRVLKAVRSVQDARIAVFVHDVIPLEYPQYQRVGTVEMFEQKMRRVREYADLIIYNSQDTKERCAAAMARWGAVPQGIVAHLGTIPPVVDRASLPAGLLPDTTYFITVGTIEPRKNHALLLDIWDRLGPDAPTLLICGGRGWNNEAVFARLDALGEDAPVREISGLSDGTLMALIEGAQALLFPSHAEGFGLPAVEALQLGTPVLCSNMATFREILANNAVYIDDSADQIWEDTIVNWSKQARDTLRVRDFEAPTWAEHFKVVLSTT